MNTRRRALPPGWYPSDERSAGGLIEEWNADPPPSGAMAAVAPHAGWAFSGRLAVRAVSALRGAETVVVIGGHLPDGYPVLMAPEKSFETPLGALEADLELAEALRSSLEIEEDRAADNTVEVQLPIVKARFPESRILWLRAPAGPRATALGKALEKAASGLGRKVSCLGSTDLTHYGPDYGFSPAGRGAAAEAWVREKSDKGFMDALLAMDPETVLERGGEGAACSAGAAAAALAFAIASGSRRASLLGYATSLETRESESFVGYCAVAFY